MSLIAQDKPSLRSGVIARTTLSKDVRYGTFQEDWCQFGGAFDSIVVDKYAIQRVKNIRSRTNWLLDNLLGLSFFGIIGLHCDVNSDSGLTILSPYPLEEIQQTPFEECSRLDCFVNKSILCGKSPQDNLRICTTHLQSGGERSEGVRTTQIDIIDQVLDEFAGEPLILTGDFNICSYELEERVYLDAVKLAKLLEKHRLVDVHHNQDGGMKCRKDFIFQRGLSLEWSSIDPEKISDHPLLTASFRK